MHALQCLGVAPLWGTEEPPSCAMPIGGQLEMGQAMCGSRRQRLLRCAPSRTPAVHPPSPAPNCTVWPGCFSSHADCGMDWKYRQVESGEWDVLEKMVSWSCARVIPPIPFFLGVWTGLGSKAREDGEVEWGSHSCPAAVSCNLRLDSMLYCTHSWLLDSARHCCHRRPAACRVMGATAARAAAVRGASIAASWRVSRRGHMVLATGAAL